MNHLTRRDAVKLTAAGAAALGAATLLAQDTAAQDDAQGKPLHEAPPKVLEEVNRIFAKMGSAVEQEVKRGAKELKVVGIATASGLKIDEKVLDELRIPHVIPVLPWCHWCSWWPWQPLWCWWWHKYHVGYQCCPWWWHRCYWKV
jgi:hypothetical protein